MDRGRTHLDKLLMGDGEDDGVIGPGVRQVSQAVEPVFVLGLGAVDPGVIDIHPDAVLPQGVDDVHHPGIAQFGAVFLEGQAHDQDAAVADADATLEHELDHRLGHVGAHAVVDAPAGG